MHQEKLRSIEAVEVACLVQGGPAEVIFLVLGATGIEEELADLLLAPVVRNENHEEIVRIRFMADSPGENFCSSLVFRGHGFAAMQASRQ